MKILAVMNEKGGVGKTFVSSQLSFFEALKQGRRVLVLDFDQQQNTSNCIAESGLAKVAGITASDILLHGKSLSEDDLNAPFLLVRGDSVLMQLERRGVEAHQQYIRHLSAFFEAVDAHFDFCVIDTNPSPDARAVAALCTATHVLAPVELKKEALDGVANLWKNVEAVKTQVNPSLTFVGFVPNLVENKPFQVANMKALYAAVGKIVLQKDDGGIAFIPNRTAYAEAQCDSRPAWKYTKASAKAPWLELRNTLLVIEKRIGLEK